MKFLYLALFSFVFLTACAVKDAPEAKTDLYQTIVQDTVAYDSVLAAHLHADKIGMQQYVMAFLKKGPNRTQDSLTAAQIQKGHMDNINRMAKEGKLVLAGPFMDDGDLRGIYVFNVKTVEEARALTETDPAIQSGRLVMELHPWYGSAVLPLITPLHERVGRE